MSTPQHRLALGSIVAIVISLVIGMGIFKLPASVAATSGTPGIFYAAWAVGGLTALMGALVYAEIGLRLPGIGGYYKIFAECYHPAVGFVVNILIVVSNAASAAIVALIGADYAADLLYGQPAGWAFHAGIALGSIALFYGLNFMGLRSSSRTQNLLTLLKTALVVLLIGAVFADASVTPRGYDANAPLLVFDGGNGWYLFLVSMVSVSFVYGGYQQTINFGGEVSSPALLPRGIILGMAVVLMLYLSLCYVYVRVIGFDQMKNATAIGALLFEALFGAAGAKVFDACMFLSVLAYLNVTLMSNPRVLYAMGKDGVLPAAFARSHPRTGAFTVGLSVFAGIALLVVFLGKGVDDILNFTMFLDSIGMATSAATLFVLRRRGIGKADEGNAPLWQRITPLLALLFIGVYAVIAFMVVLKNPTAAAIGMGLLLLLGGLYAWNKKRYRE